MPIHRHPSDHAVRAPEAGFTGKVVIDGFFRRAAPSRLTGAVAAFEAGARTPWKVSASGQTLVVTDGVGWAQLEGEEAVEIRSGDLVWCPPGVRHWEGASADGPMTYVAMHEAPIEFGAAVGDEEYFGAQRRGLGAA